jgi:hypothetical protein
MGSLSLTLALKNRRSRLSPALPQKYERVSPNLNKTHGFYGILWRSQRLKSCQKRQLFIHSRVRKTTKGAV